MLNGEVKKELKIAKKFLDEFEFAVKTNQPELVESYFADDVKAYGTVNEVLLDFSELKSKQWNQVWNVVEDWRITSLDRLDTSSEHFSCAFRWWRLNKNGRELSGRATIYGRFAEDRLVVEHTHFSLLTDGLGI
jgi:hypothetical protein